MEKKLNIFDHDDTIFALATPQGIGAIAVIRVSGKKAFSVCEKIFKPANSVEKIDSASGNSIVYGHIYDRKNLVDEVVVAIYKTPKSYTGEDIVEISCHGSAYIQQKILKLLIKSGARMAEPGEFTMKAFINGKMDLSQAEAVADLIAANTKTSHAIAVKHIRGHFSDKIRELRARLVEFVSLIELELDFAEEDVSHADRTKLTVLLKNLMKEITRLRDSFSYGNVIKKGIPVVIAGKPNVGKSTLLNALLNEDRAIVSEIPGTTRDTIEDLLVINGIGFRFIDTAGLRNAENEIEDIGIKKTYEKIRQASIILYMFDASETPLDEIKDSIQDFQERIDEQNSNLIVVGNKIDKLLEVPASFAQMVELETIFVSAKRKENIQMIIDSLTNAVQEIDKATTDNVVTNIRHFEALQKALKALENANAAIKDELPADLLAADVRQAVHYLGLITGEVTPDDILGSIFKNFCIGK